MTDRKSLPQQNGKLCLTDGGVETVLLFQKGIDLPGFATFPILDRDGGEDLFEEYLMDYVDIAHRHKHGLILDTHTWRANPDWGGKLGYDRKELTSAHRRSTEFLERLRKGNEREETPILISGSIGPRGDGYQASEVMTPEEAASYNRFQTQLFADSAVDFVSAMTITNVDEAAGIVRAAAEFDLPVVISFTVETDGCLPSGQPLHQAIRECDALSDSYASYYMINCAHPSHFSETLEVGSEWLERLGGVRVNASRLSHEELDNAEELDDGDPAELGKEVGELFGRIPSLNVLGGCCGTDSRHVVEIACAIGEQSR